VGANFMQRCEIGEMDVKGSKDITDILPVEGSFTTTANKRILCASNFTGK
jgi:hypothetical protein